MAVDGVHLTAKAAHWHLPSGRPRRIGMLVATAAVLGGIGGYALRDRPATVTVRVGQAYSTPYQIGIAVKGWSFADIPLHVPWRGVGGMWHYGERPACLPPSGVIRNVTVGTVNVSGGGGPSYPQVVWVDCGATR